MFFFQIIKLNAQVMRGGAQAGMPEQLLNGSQIDATLLQMSGERGAQQVRIIPGPWFVAMGMLQALIAQSATQGVPCVTVYNFPNRPPRGKRAPVLGDKQRQVITWRCAFTQSNPVSEQGLQFAGNRRKPFPVAFPQYVNKVIQQAGRFQAYQLSGSHPGFIGQAQQAVVTETDKSVQRRRSQQPGHLLFVQIAGQALRHSPRFWNHGGIINQHILPGMRPAEKRTKCRKFLIQSVSANRIAARSDKSVNLGLFRVIDIIDIIQKALKRTQVRFYSAFRAVPGRQKAGKIAYQFAAIGFNIILLE